MKNFLEQKSRLRREGLARREQITSLRREEAACCLLDFIIHNVPTGMVLSYIPFHSELDVRAINYWLAQEKRVFFPKRQGVDLIPISLPLATIQGLDSPNALDKVKGEEVDAQLITIALVPAIAFDRDKFRLGYGGGYYDRFLAKYAHIWTIGVGFKEQQVACLPREEHDIPLNLLCLT